VDFRYGEVITGYDAGIRIKSIIHNQLSGIEMIFDDYHFRVTLSQAFCYAKGAAMNIRQKTLWTVSATLVILIVVLYAVMSAIVMRGFGRVEQADARNNVERVVDAFRNRIGMIDASVFTWSQWTDAYEYIASPSREFETTNLSSTIFTGMNINFFVMMTKDFEIRYQAGYDLNKNEPLPIPESLRSYFNKDGILFRNTDPGKSTGGFVMLPEGPLMIVSAPVTNTAGDKPYNGFIVFARYFDTSEQRALSSITHLALDFSTDGTPNTEIAAVPVNGSIIDGKVSLTDINGKPVYHLTVHIPRAVHYQGLQSLRWLIAAIIVVGLLFGIIILCVLESLVLSRVSRLSNEVHEISINMDFNRRVNEDGKDEISRLSLQINGLVAAVAEILHSLEQEQ
jgi:sensor domain CHASE-containing protein